MSWCEVGLGNFSGILVSLEGFVCGGGSLVAERKLSEVAVVVALPVF